ncbi:hypothetical protein SLA2020_062760 [Shorea laevis]
MDYGEGNIRYSKCSLPKHSISKVKSPICFWIFLKPPLSLCPNVTTEYHLVDGVCHEKREQIVDLEAHGRLSLQASPSPTRQQESVLFCFGRACLDWCCVFEHYGNLASSYSHPVHILPNKISSVRERNKGREGEVIKKRALCFYVFQEIPYSPDPSKGQQNNEDKNNPLCCRQCSHGKIL